MDHLHNPKRDLRERSSLPELPPEIRFEPIGCPPEAIEKANILERRTGARRFKPVEIALEHMRVLQSPSKARVESWLQHPDEQVVIAFLTKKRIGPGTKMAEYVKRYLLPRALDQARDRNEVWTPLLDILSNCG